jgi:hypothetical protein
MKPFLTGRRQVSSPALQAITGASIQDGVSRSAAHAHKKGENARPATVECVKQGDKIVRLIVTCSCGERMEIDCLYPAGG